MTKIKDIIGIKERISETYPSVYLSNGYNECANTKAEIDKDEIVRTIISLPNKTYYPYSIAKAIAKAIAQGKIIKKENKC